MRQYLFACLVLHSFISVPARAEEGDGFHQFFQVLGIEDKGRLVKTYDDIDDMPETGLLMVSLQPLERWNPSLSADDAVRCCSHVHLFRWDEAQA